MKVSIIVPHMDDEILGLGGTIAKHVAMGDEVSVCVVANRAYGHEYIPSKIEQQKKHAKKAQEILGYQELIFLDLPDEQLDDKTINILIPIEEYLMKVKPEVLYLNHRGDSNQDHRAVFQAGIIACRTFANDTIKQVLCYEVLSSTEQAPPFAEYAFMPNYYVNIEKYLEAKIQALNCYEDEIRQFPHPRSSGGIKTLAQKRGLEIGYQAAEAFCIVRQKWS